jgi:vancomycin resistance protein YoaR
MPGEIFSYNPALGKRTPEAGWKEADGYVGNETVKEYGGGICQASSCLYLSALLADLEIVERVNHGFISAYMPYGMDATVSWGGPEFRFKNSSEYPIRIEAWSSGGAVTVRLMGTDTKDYYVKMSYEILDTDPFETVEEEFEADNEKGYKDGDVVISGYTGYKIRTYRCKYDKETKELISREVEATSTYDRRDEVICKIKTEATEDPSTDPSTDGPVVEPSEPPSVDPTDNNTDLGTGGTVTEDG